MNKIALVVLLVMACSGQVRKRSPITEVAEKIPKVPVVITIKKVEGEKVYFEPLIAPTFYGILQGTPSDKKISHCVATAEPVGKMADGGDLINLVLECEGGVRIVLQGVDFF